MWTGLGLGLIKIKKKKPFSFKHGLWTKKKNWFFLGRKRVPEVEDDLNYGLILSPGLCISCRP